jgi:hypothetical protein
LGHESINLDEPVVAVKAKDESLLLLLGMIKAKI